MEVKENFTAICYIQPSLYRTLDEIVKKKIGGKTIQNFP